MKKEFLETIGRYLFEQVIDDGVARVDGIERKIRPCSLIMPWSSDRIVYTRYELDNDGRRIECVELGPDKFIGRGDAVRYTLKSRSLFSPTLRDEDNSLPLVKRLERI